MKRRIYVNHFVKKNKYNTINALIIEFLHWGKKKQKNLEAIFIEV